MERTVDKAPDAFRTISEVADDLAVPQHVLRFWETKFPQLRPMKRGGGRRYYRPNDVELLRGIRHLLYGEGYTIRGVQRILREKGIAQVAETGRRAAEQPVAPRKPAPPRPVQAVPPRPVPTAPSGQPAPPRPAQAALLDEREALQAALGELADARRILAGAVEG